MADFPTNIYEPRTLENLSGLYFDDTKKTILFAEDYNNIASELVAIEEYLENDIYPIQLKCKKVSLTSSQIKLLNTNPFEIIPNAGSEKLIEIVTSFVKYNFITPEYSNDFGIALVYDNVYGYNLGFFGNILSNTTSKIFSRSSLSDYEHELFSNKSVKLYAFNRNPTLGNGTLDVYVYYRIVTL
jgi:hypothetical protein